MITAKITKIKKFKSKYGGWCYLVLLKDNKGTEYITYLYCKFHNYKRWSKVMKVGTKLSNLKLKNKKKLLIDADSKFVEVK